jgi:[NiFe] hydrogenase large subunit/hydrogenase large subunit
VNNHLCYGEFPEGDLADTDKLYFPRGIILGGDLSRVHPFDPTKIEEYINSSWYEYSVGDEKGLHPYDGETKAKYTGPPPPWDYLQGLPKYTWMKSPRYEGRAMQVGPLSRMLVAYGSGHEEVREMVKAVLDTLQVGPAALFSTLGRTAARGMETVLLARRMEKWFGMLVDRIRGGDTQTFSKEKWDPSTWPKEEARGFGWLDAPRGALGHWVRIKDGKITKYQCVVPSTWNCSPRDGQGQMGPYEASLVDNHPLVRPDQPLEILRTIHSFDPCMSCGVHVLDASGAPIVR